MKRIIVALLCVMMLVALMIPMAPTAGAITKDGGTICLHVGKSAYETVCGIVWNYSSQPFPRVIGIEDIPGLDHETEKTTFAPVEYTFILKGAPTKVGTYPITCTVSNNGSGHDSNSQVTAYNYNIVVMENIKKTENHTAFVNQPYSFKLVERVYPCKSAKAEGLEGTGLSLQKVGSDWYIKGTPTNPGNITFKARLLYVGNAYKEYTINLKVTNPNTSSSFTAKTGESVFHTIDISNSYFAGYTSGSITSGSLPDGMRLVDSSEGLKVMGTPTKPGSYVAKINVKFSDGASATHILTIKVECSQHQPEDEWYTDGTNHWRFCKLCEKGIDQGKHTGGEKTCRYKAQCDVCRLFYGNFGDHMWSTTWDYSTPDGHYHSCNMAGCGLFSEIYPHTPGPAATKDTPQTCTDCGFVLKAALGHTHKLRAVAAKKATCTTPGNIEYYECEGCGKWFKDAKGTKEITKASEVVIEAGEHTFESGVKAWHKNETEHWRLCTVCGAVDEEQKGGHEDRDDDMTCDVCLFKIPEESDSSGDSEGSTSSSTSSGTESTDKTSSGTESTDKTSSGTESSDDTSSGTESSDNTSSDSGSADTTDSEDETDSEGESGGTKKPNKDKFSGSDNTGEGKVTGLSKLWIILGAAAGVLVAAAVVVTVVLVKRKKTRG